MPSRVEKGRGPRQRKELDCVGRKTRIPSQSISLNDGSEGTISEQEVDAPGAGRSATNAGRFSANVSPFGSDKGVQAVELLKFHIKVAPYEARDPTGSFGIQQRFPAKGASVEKAMG